MKRLVCAAVALMLGAGAAMAADPLEGMWRTAADDNGHSGLIQVAPCGDKLCGVLVKAYDSAGKQIQSANIGRKIISETVNNGNGKYSGKVYSPDRNKTYKSRLEMSGSTLNVQGCVMGICRNGGTWKKVQ